MDTLLSSLYNTSQSKPVHPAVTLDRNRTDHRGDAQQLQSQLMLLLLSSSNKWLCYSGVSPEQMPSEGPLAAALPHKSHSLFQLTRKAVPAHPFHLHENAISLLTCAALNARAFLFRTGS